MKRLALGAIYVFSILIAFVAGGRLSYKQCREHFGVAIADTQAMLWFNHLLQFREIEADLSTKGCERVALEKTKIAIDGEMQLLSSFHKEHPDSGINKYISDRDAKLLDVLNGYKSSYGNSWTEPDCGPVKRCVN